MKKNFLFAMAMAAVFAGCSSDDDPVANAGGEVSGENFIALSINLPTQNSTRAFDESTQLADGLETEYSVKEACLVIFDGTEAGSKVVETHDLSTSFSNNNDAPNHITQTSTKVVKKVAASVQPTYGMLVVLNNNDVLDYTSMVGQTLTEVLALTSDDSKILTTMTDKGLFMTNAPLATAVGGASWSGDISLLVPITNVYPTETAAQAGTADQVYVERAVVKVTMQDGTAGNLTTGKIDGANVSYNISGWNLSNTNTTSYVVRNTLKSDMDTWAKYTSNGLTPESYRFIGTTQVTGSAKYRTYFAKDPNYDTDATLNNVETFVDKFGDNNPLYCLENTFDVARMTNKNTTHVIIKATLGDGTKDLYVVNDEKSIIYDDITKVDAIVYNAIGSSILSTNLTGTVDVNDFDITYAASSDKTHNSEVSSIILKSTSTGEYSDGGTAVKTALASAIAAINGKVKISKYTGGASYYAARIKHFGDGETPWNTTETDKPASGNIYPSAKADANYLGRYGVLRNNWYDLKVTGIAMIGEPTIESVTDEEDDTDTDDELDSYIALQINILSWAKRTQDVEL